MMSKKNVQGKCRICGKDGRLSFEHVPPRAAYNRATAVEYTVESWFANREEKGKQKQGSVGSFTLCKQCNNDTGSWYGAEYVKWARIGTDILSIVNAKPEALLGKDELRVTLRNVYPLRFLKQVVTCFFSVLGAAPSATFTENNPELVRFVLDRHETAFPEDYKFYVRLYQPSALRRIPIGGKINVTYRKDEDGNIVPSSLQQTYSSVLSEFTHPPFALVMTHGTGFPEATEITGCRHYGYDECVDIPLILKIGSGTYPYPGSYV